MNDESAHHDAARADQDAGTIDKGHRAWIKRNFDQLAKGVREMKRRMAGNSVRSARTIDPPAPDVRVIRKAARVSRSQCVWDRFLVKQELKPFGGVPFEGFKTFAELSEERCASVPRRPGVYLVLWCHSRCPRYLERSPAWWLRGRDPAVSVEKLKSKWVEGASCIYIGKAGHFPPRKATLRSRISQFERFGRGKSASHWGSRYIWQIQVARSLLVCWFPTPADSPSDFERKFLCQFRLEYGCLPFGNIKPEADVA